jgi:hypothetical protein
MHMRKLQGITHILSRKDKPKRPVDWSGDTIPLPLGRLKGCTTSSANVRYIK